MKNTAVKIFFMAAICAAVISCTKEAGPKKDIQPLKVTFVAESTPVMGENSTRTYIGEDGLTPYWSEKQTLVLAYFPKDSEFGTIEIPMISGGNTTSATFQGTIDEKKLNDITKKGITKLYPYIKSNKNNFTRRSSISVEPE